MRVILEGVDADVVKNGIFQEQQAAPKYQAAVDRGRVFSQTLTPAGLAMVAFTDTAIVGSLPIWNPSGSGVKCILMTHTAVHVSGTAINFAYGLMARTGVGSDLATGSQITAFAETTPVNGHLGGGQTSRVKSSNAGVVTIVAGVAEEFVRAIGGSGDEQDDTATGLASIEHDFDGAIHVYPGTLVWIAASGGSGAFYGQTLSWEEVLL